MAETEDVTEEEAPKSPPPAPITNWWSDPPKLIPILLSSLALCISGLGWWESHRGRLINEEINRPILELENVKFENGKAAPILVIKQRAVLPLSFDIKNVGKSSARIDLITSETSSFEPGLTPCNLVNQKPVRTKNQIILPGHREHFEQAFWVLSECQQQAAYFVLGLEAHYTDVGSGKQHSQNLDASLLVVPEEEKKDENKSVAPNANSNSANTNQ
jgi:hypothetical protein